MNESVKYNYLGNSDLKVSQVSFGCMSLEPASIGNAGLLQEALNHGINFFDTADLYQKGGNEKLVGEAFKGIRQEVIIATKVGNQWRPDGSGWDWNPTKSYILQAVENSLYRLQTDYIDLYQLHGGTLEDPIDDTIEAFELLKQQGKIRYYGISSIRPNVIREYVKRANLTCVMMQYSLLDRRPEESCLELLAQHKISVLARGSLAQGLLAGKEPKKYLNYPATAVQEAAAAIATVATQSIKPVEVAIQYALHAPVVASAVLGIRTEAQVEAAIQSAKSAGLSESVIQVLKQSLPANYYEQHR